ncbi:MAG TPA: ATP synthase F1 subunit delta [Anaerovoracaceae bacterium]|nr:ATP synthase F1 subunit delta [Anaerovoracaceae bacterium]
MAELTVAMTYGNALFMAAQEVGKIDEIKEEIEAVNEVFQEEEDYFKLLNSPAVSTRNKKELVRSIFEGKVCQEVISFIYILIDKDRLLQFERIVRMYKQEANRAEGFGSGEIYSAVPLTDRQISKFEEQAGKVLNEKVKLVNKIDPGLIGGVKVLVDGKVMDASIKGRLNTLTHQIKNN